MKNKNTKMWRQGDVLIERVDSLPQDLKPANENGRVILAHGEVTGHAHEVAEPKKAAIFSTTATFTMPGDLPSVESMSRLALKVKGKTEVKHQEHSKIPLDRGSYRVTRQREYRPAANINVAD